MESNVSKAIAPPGGGTNLLNPTWSLEVFAAKEKCREALREKLAHLALTGRARSSARVHRHTHRNILTLNFASDHPHNAGSRGLVSE